MKCLTAILILGLVAGSYSLKCYVCDSESDSSCKDPYSGSATHSKECPPDEATGCTKMKGVGTLANGEAFNIVSRQCGSDDNNNHCAQDNPEKHIDVGGKGELWRCTCEGDNCNSGSIVTVTLQLLTAAMVKWLL